MGISHTIDEIFASKLLRGYRTIAPRRFSALGPPCDQIQVEGDLWYTASASHAVRSRGCTIDWTEGGTPEVAGLISDSVAAIGPCRRSWGLTCTRRLHLLSYRPPPPVRVVCAIDLDNKSEPVVTTVNGQNPCTRYSEI